MSITYGFNIILIFKLSKMQELTELRASQVQAGGCGKYMRQIDRLRKIYQGGTMPTAEFEAVLDILVNDYVNCKME